MLADNKYVLIGVALAALALVVLVKKKGAAAAVGEDVGHAVVDLAGGVATGVIDGISVAVGIPTIKELIRDPVQCRAYMDENGTLSGAKHCTELAYLNALEPWESVKETAGSIWDWFTEPSASDYQTVTNTGAYGRQ